MGVVFVFTTVAALTLAVTALSAGFFLGYSEIARNYVKQRIVEQTSLAKGTGQYNRWRESQFPVEFKVYVFNVTNPYEIEHQGAMPIVREIGPLVYHQRFRRERIGGNEKDDTITYYQHLELVFRRSLSAFDEDFKVTVPSFALQVILQDVEGEEMALETVEKKVFDELRKMGFSTDSIFVKMPIKDILFVGDKTRKHMGRGWFSSLVAIVVGVATIIKNVPVIVNAVKKIVKVIKKVVKKVVKDIVNVIKKKKGKKKSSRQLKHNDTNTQTQIQIVAGIKDIDLLGQIKSWRGKSHWDTWAGGPKSACNILRGTDSTIFPPQAFSGKSSTMYIFDVGICRTFKLTAIGEVNFNGITGIKAIIGPENMENKGENSCYCIKKTRNLAGHHQCFPKGFCDMGNCHNGPLVISFPHMLWANEVYANTVKGLEPDEEKHVSFVSVEPTTGIVLQSRKRIQFNIPLRPLDGINRTRDLPAAMLPLMWTQESFDLPGGAVAKMKDEYFSKLFLLDIASYALIGSGLIGGSAVAVYVLFPRF